MSDDDEVRLLRQRVRELEEKLTRAAAGIDAILANIPAVLYVKDIEGRYVYGSRHCFEVMGVTAEQAVGHTAADLFPGTMGERFTKSDQRVLRGEPVTNDSYAVPLPGGPRHFFGVRFPIPGPDGKPIGLFGFAVDVTRRVELEQELQRLAITDPLTGVNNRRRLDEFLAAELARSGRSGEPLSIVLCDVDHFKRFNDHYGHPAGDACLVAVAGALAGVARRPGDLVARYGGEEFALVLSNTKLDGANGIAERIRTEVRALGIPHQDNDGREIVTISAGVACVVGTWSAQEVLCLVDRALYDAKAQGRDRIIFVEQERHGGAAGRTE